MALKDFFSFKHNGFLWLNLLAMVLALVGVIVGTLVWLDHYTRHGQSVSVPNVHGMQVNIARQVLAESSLELVVIDSTYISTQPAGAIMEQKPLAGAKVKSDRLIFVTVNSQSVPRKPIPDIIDNCSLREAKAKLLGAGFRLDTIERVQGENEWIYGVKYAGRELSPYDQVPVGAKLVLVVGDARFFLEEMDLDSILSEHPVEVVEHGQNSDIDESWF